MRVLAFICLLSSALYGQVINAASCSTADVQTAFNAVTSSTKTVNIPAGTCHWTSQAILTVPSGSTSLTVIGAGSQSIVGGNDVTVIIDDIARGNDIPDLVINTIAGGSFRLSGISIETGVGGVTFHGVLQITGLTRSLRVDHIHLLNINAKSMQVDDALGLIDHILLDMVSGSTNNGINIDTANYGGHTFGDGAWAAATGLGTTDFLYVEDSIFNNGIANDCGIGGGKFVFRHNTFTDSSVQTHPTGGAGRSRGCRAWEVYSNTFNATKNNFNVFFMSSGTGVVWNNTTTASQYSNFVSIHSMRKDNSTYTEQPTPTGWGYCGTAFNGTGSNWDQNQAASTGYRCMDQPGQGVGDLLSGDFPNTTNTATACNSGSACAWPREALEPVYEWNDPWTGAGGGSFWANQATTVLISNSDYYLWCNASSPTGCTSFNGTVGTGTGLLSARPATCTPAVGFWATDTQTLYQCSSTNTWTSIYTPLTYPHPLQGTTVLGYPTKGMMILGMK